KITTFLNQEAIYVAHAFRFDPPILNIPNNNLSDENVDKKLIIGLLDRGIISPQTVLDVYGEDFVVELERIDHNNKEFKKRNIELLSPLKKEDKGVNSKGRPLTSTDIGNRKTRSAKPRTSVSAMLYALDAVETIDKFIVHQYLSQNSITNARQLTNDNKEDINNLRLFILSCVKFGEDLTKDRLNTLIETFESCYDSRIFTKFDENYQ